MKKMQNVVVLVLLFSGLISANAQTSTEIANANKAGKAVFLIAYNATGPEADKAVSVANEARKSLTSTSTVLKMNTTDAKNAALVSKFRLAGAPSPLILVLDKNGNPTGGFELKDATAKKLIDLIPSPKSSEVIDALIGGKSVLLVAYKESMVSKKSIMDNCFVACNKMANKSVVIAVDMEDKQETKLLQNLKCDMNAKEPVTYVLNKAGQVTGAFTGITDVNKLISSATKVASSGCCPGGSKKSGCQ